MAAIDRDLHAAIAVTRFGLGARPGEIASAAADPRAWLTDQIRATGADQPQSSGETADRRFAELRQFQMQRRAMKQDGAAANDPDAPDPVKMAQKLLRRDTATDFLARARLGATTAAGFREHWALFWFNHFTVAANKLQTATLVGPFEAEAIRPNVFGRFRDLLLAAETHPAMMLYLDQVQSVGPDSAFARFVKSRQERTGARLRPAIQRDVGLNENLAREIMELHTVGVSGGYTQSDVTEFARAMTGLSIGGFRGPESQIGEPVFRIQAHEPGERTVMGVRYPAGGREQAVAILTDLAAKPQTAHFICGKIARHFVADEPPPELTERLQRAWMGSDGDLAEVARALITAPEAWDPAPHKFKTPYEFIVSSYRAAGAEPRDIRHIAPILTALGQKPFTPGSPKGWADDAGAWAAPDAIVKRMQFAQAFAGQATAGRDPTRLAQDALGARLTPATATAVARAETRPEGFALLLMSPEFQRR